MTNRILLSGRSEMLKPIITELLAFRQIIDEKDVGTIYAYTNDLNSVRRKGKPKVSLFFSEDTSFNKLKPRKNVSEGRRRQEGLICFRLMNETTQSFSKANGTALGNRIKAIFGANGGFVWNKGKTMYSYCDWDMGYQFQLLCKTEIEAKRIVTATLSLQNHTADWKNFNSQENNQESIKYPENPGTHTVMGETLALPKERPIVDVRFQYGCITLDGVKDPITLYDRSRKRVGALTS